MSSALARRPFPRSAPTRGASERRFGVALLFSGALHVLIALSVARFVGALPVAGPFVTGEAAPLQAVLQQPPMPEIPAVDLFPVPPLPEELTPAPPPQPAPEPAAAPKSAPASAAAPSSFGIAPDIAPIVSADPNGRITYGMVSDPAAVGRGIARRLAERYPTVPYRAPALQGSFSVAYPIQARDTHTSARIAAVLDVDQNGTVTGVTLVPDEPVFGPAVMSALKDARLRPAQTPAGPVPYWAIVKFVFAIAPAPVGAHAANAPTASN